MDLDKLNLILWLDFRLEPFYAAASAALKNIAPIKWSKLNHFAIITKVMYNSLKHTVLFSSKQGSH